VVICALEMTLLERGYSLELGKGLKTVGEVFDEFRGYRSRRSGTFSLVILWPRNESIG